MITYGFNGDYRKGIIGIIIGIYYSHKDGDSPTLIDIWIYGGLMMINDG